MNRLSLAGWALGVGILLHAPVWAVEPAGTAGADAISRAAAAELTVPARRLVGKTVHIPGGSYAAPYICRQPNTEYVLDGDLEASGTAILVRASRVVVNLNGKTVTYNQKAPGEGVYIDEYNLSDIAIINGAIVQGAALSEGDLYGAGNNPIRSKGTERLQVARINARYGGRDVGGIFVSTANSIFEENTLEDMWKGGTLKNRHQGISAILAQSGYNIFRNNVIKNCRQRGITVTDHDQVYGNTITINSLATNSYGIMGYKARNVKVHDNTITGRGEHPIGIGFVSAGTRDIDIYRNVIDVQVTRIGEEYGGTSCLNAVKGTGCGNYAVGFRTNWGGNNIRFHDNTITVHTDAAYRGTYSPTGQAVLVNAKGRGLMVETVTGESSRFFGNTITALDRDGSGKAFGIACTGESFGEMTFEGNTVIGNTLNVALGDEYGACGGYPLFLRNTFVRQGDFPGYRTVAAEYGGYFDGTARFVSNRYQGGADPGKIELNPAGKGKQSVYFGREAAVRLETEAGDPIGAAVLSVGNGGPPFDSRTVTAADGTGRLTLYDYELHDRDGGKKAALRPLAPHLLEVVLNGGFTLIGRSEQGAAAWDHRAGSGSKQVPLYRDGVRDPSRVLTVNF